MTGSLIQIVIDTCGVPDAFNASNGPPPVVISLQSAEAYPTLVFAAPVILCEEQDVALARGAFLVSGDEDGRVIGFDPVGKPADRLALAAMTNFRLAPLWPGRVFSPRMIVPADPAPDIPLMPASLRGVWVPEPNLWAERCGTRFGDQQYG
ncbi:MAG: hypothetical protein MRY64_11550 [Hyphomonadaceae bacterium]|nr:hypothetical protein [Hyphomonadaceae bacterium]